MIYSCWGYKTPEYTWLTRSACYATLFSPFSSFAKTKKDQTITSLFSLFRVAKGVMSIHTANWYWHSYLKHCIPQRMHDGITVKRMFSKGYQAYLKSRDINHDIGDGGDYPVPWLEIHADITKINANDLFLLFTATRLAQEQPRMIKVMYELATMLNLPLDLAFLLAGIDNLENSNHAVIGNYNFHRQWPDISGLLGWSLAQRWENMPKNATDMLWLPMGRIGSRSMEISKYLTENIPTKPDPNLVPYGPDHPNLVKIPEKRYLRSQHEGLITPVLPMVSELLTEILNAKKNS